MRGETSESLSDCFEAFAKGDHMLPEKTNIFNESSWESACVIKGKKAADALRIDLVDHERNLFIRMNINVLEMIWSVLTEHAYDIKHRCIFSHQLSIRSCELISHNGKA